MQIVPASDVASVVCPCQDTSHGLSRRYGGTCLPAGYDCDTHLWTMRSLTLPAAIASTMRASSPAMLSLTDVAEGLSNHSASSHSWEGSKSYKQTKGSDHAVGYLKLVARTHLHAALQANPVAGHSDQ